MQEGPLYWAKLYVTFVAIGALGFLTGDLLRSLGWWPW